MRQELTPALVLHSRSYRETSLLLEVFSREAGRIGAVARGARRPGARLRGVLRPFQALLVSWSGRGELATVTGAEPQGAPFLVSGEKLASGFYLNELLLRLLARWDPHPPLFDVYVDTLARLRDTAENAEAVLRTFERALLRELGYGLTLEREAGDGPPVRPERLYYYRLEVGPERESAGASDAVPVHGETLLALAAGRLEDKRSLKEAKRLTRAALSRYLGGRPLASRRIWKKQSTGG